MNNRSSGRRRSRGGRSNNRGPNDGNRLDNRARGNANQLCEKYKSMARDAHQQGDRVMNEYYLQFADHYFRVLTETNLRKEEQKRERESTRPEKTDQHSERQSAKPSDSQSDKPPAKKEQVKRHARAKSDDSRAAGKDDSEPKETIEADRLPASLSISATPTEDAEVNGRSEAKPKARRAPARKADKPEDDKGDTAEA
jgi:hypothetical protein